MKCALPSHGTFESLLISKILAFDMLVVKGEMDLEETLMQYKQKPHLLRILEDPNYMKTKTPEISMNPGQSPFMRQFLKSDE